MLTPIIALETSSHLRNNNNGRMAQCAAEYTRLGDSAPFRVYSHVHALARLENGVATILHTPTT